MKKSARTILIICMALLVLFILGNAILPGQLSYLESGWVQRRMTPVLEYVQSGRIQVALERLADALPGRLSDGAYRLTEFLDEHILSLSSYLLVRKTAHFFEYLLLGVFIALLLARKDGRGRFFLPLLLCAAMAVADEWLQKLPGGRSSQLPDVYVDLAGAVVGIVLALILRAILRARRDRQADIGKIS